MRRDAISTIGGSVIRPSLLWTGVLSTATLAGANFPRTSYNIFNSNPIISGQVDKGPSETDLKIFEKHFNFLKRLEAERDERIENFWKGQREEAEDMLNSLKPSLEIFQPKYNQAVFERTWGIEKPSTMYEMDKKFTPTEPIFKPSVQQNLFESKKFLDEPKIKFEEMEKTESLLKPKYEIKIPKIKLDESSESNQFKPEWYEITVSHVHKSKNHNYLHIDTYLRPILEDGKLGNIVARKDGIALENFNPHVEYKWNVPGLIEGEFTITDALKSIKKYKPEL